MAVIEKFFQHDHPASQGHFPGNPIIPGAVLLGATLQAIEADLGISLAPFQIRSAKFLHPARPGDRVLIQFSRTARGEIRFTCATAGIPVLTGQMSCHTPPTAK